jgi:putative lumazine-binding protein
MPTTATVQLRSSVSEYDAIMATMQLYVEGGRQGKSEIMRPAFHPNATIVGFCSGTLLAGPIQQLFDWIEANGPSPNTEDRITSVEIIHSIALVKLEARQWAGKMAGARADMTDLFTLLKVDGEWKITQKIFHWYDS